jgi:hypothetical protein
VRGSSARHQSSLEHCSVRLEEGRRGRAVSLDSAPHTRRGAELQGVLESIDAPPGQPATDWRPEISWRTDNDTTWIGSPETPTTGSWPDSSETANRAGHGFGIGGNREDDANRRRRVGPGKSATPAPIASMVPAISWSRWDTSALGSCPSWQTCRCGRCHKPRMRTSPGPGSGTVVPQCGPSRASPTETLSQGRCRPALNRV